MLLKPPAEAMWSGVRLLASRASMAPPSSTYHLISSSRLWATALCISTPRGFASLAMIVEVPYTKQVRHVRVRSRDGEREWSEKIKTRRSDLKTRSSDLSLCLSCLSLCVCACLCTHTHTDTHKAHNSPPAHIATVAGMRHTCISINFRYRCVCVSIGSHLGLLHT